VAALAGVVWLATTTLEQAEAPLPVLATVPEFALTEASGDEVALADLRGKPWVADLIFTSCAGVSAHDEGDGDAPEERGTSRTSASSPSASIRRPIRRPCCATTPLASPMIAPAGSS
jgi:hypothetical protein